MTRRRAEFFGFCVFRLQATREYTVSLDSQKRLDFWVRLPMRDRPMASFRSRGPGGPPFHLEPAGGLFWTGCLFWGSFLFWSRLDQKRWVASFEAVLGRFGPFSSRCTPERWLAVFVQSFSSFSDLRFVFNLERWSGRFRQIFVFQENWDTGKQSVDRLGSLEAMRRPRTSFGNMRGARGTRRG